MRTKTLIALSATTLLASVWWLSAQSEPAPVTAAPVATAIPVTAIKPTVRDVTLTIEAIGTLQPSSFLEVRPQVSGTIEEILVAEGDWVTPGTPLMRIEALPYQIKVQELEAQFASDQLTFDAATKKLNRYRELADKDLIAQSEWDEWETQAAKIKTQMAGDNARLQTACMDCDHCLIKATIAGRVGRINTYLGSLVSSGQAKELTTISNMDPLFVEFSLTENEFARIAGKRLPIQLKTIASEPIQTTGTISFFDNHFDGSSGLIFVRGKVANPSFQLRAGQTVTVHVPVEMCANALVIPQKAVRFGQEGPYVLVVQDDQTIAKRLITLGESQDNEVIVCKGLVAEEAVVTEGHLRLAVGTLVKVTP